jgi:homoserine O-acetyltransferase
VLPPVHEAGPSPVHHHPALRLQSGQVLAGACTAYRTLGRLDEDGRNAVLVLHGYTTGPSMLDAGANVAEGSWSELVGPGKAIDSERHFVICPNMLGSSYGSTGPGSVNPATGRPYGIDFPRLTVRDIVDAQKDLLDALGVQRLAAVVGPSLGGYQALQWAVRHPGMVARVVAAVSAPWNPPGAVQAESLRQQLAAQPAWNGGHPEAGAMVHWLTALRVATLTRYGVDDDLRARLPDAAERAAEVQRLAREWAGVFDPNALLTLAIAAEGFDLRDQLSAIRAPLLMVMSRSDQVFSPALAREFAPLLSAAGVRWSYLELDSDKGHFASGADAALWSDTLRRFMDTPPEAWASWGLPP